MKIVQFSPELWTDQDTGKVVFHYNDSLHLLSDFHSEVTTTYEVSPRVFETVREMVRLYGIENMRLAITSAVLLSHASDGRDGCVCGERFDSPAGDDKHAIHQASAVLWAFRPNGDRS